MRDYSKPFFLADLDEIIDPDYFSAEDRKNIIQSAWNSFLNEKKESQLPPLSDEEYKKRVYALDDLVFAPPRKLSKKQQEYESRYTGAFIRLFKAFNKADGVLSHSEV